MEERDWLMELSKQGQLTTILDTNDYTKQFGLVLSEQDAEILVQDRSDSLQEEQRVEFGKGILDKLIFAFCDSPYIYQDNYVDSIGRLQSIFYLYKNESLDEVTDDELIDYMKEVFEGECQGSFDYLEDTCLEEFARVIRQGTRRFIGRYQVDE